MKKRIFVFLSMFVLFGCSKSDDIVLQYRYEFLPIESYDLPDYFIFGQTYNLNFYFQRPSTCHRFSGFYYEIEENTRTVAIQSLVINNPNCQPLSPQGQLSTAPMSFRVEQHGQYVFKLFKGKDDDGNIIYEDVIIQVY
jgi:hypothetical protein